AEGLDEDVVGREVARERVGRLQCVAQQRKQVRVGADAGGLLGGAGLGQRGQQLDEPGDGEHAGQRAARYRDRGGVGGPRAVFEVELVRVELAARRGAAHGQRERGGQCRGECLVGGVLVQRGQRVALEQERL